MSYYDVVGAEYLGDYRIRLAFEDGKSGVVDFRRYLDIGGVFEAWKDLEAFRRFRVDRELGTVVWDGEIDVAPETLHHLATGEPLPAWMEADAESPKTA